MQDNFERYEIITNKTVLRIVDNYINNILDKKIRTKTSILIRHEELELLSLSIRNKHPDIYNSLKTKAKGHFFFNLILTFKIVLERKTKRLLFLTIRNGNYVIIDSWIANKEDWEIESSNRRSAFNFLKREYFIAKESIPGIKSVEDFIILINVIKTEELERIFNKTKIRKLKLIEKNYTNL